MRLDIAHKVFDQFVADKFHAVLKSSALAEQFTVEVLGSHLLREDIKTIVGIAESCGAELRIDGSGWVEIS
jgi:hypothetical protein